MGLFLGGYKTNKHNQEIREWREAYYLQQVRCILQIIFKAMSPEQRK
jgi:hypothetical protein